MVEETFTLEFFLSSLKFIVLKKEKENGEDTVRTIVDISLKAIDETEFFEALITDVMYRFKDQVVAKYREMTAEEDEE